MGYRVLLLLFAFSLPLHAQMGDHRLSVWDAQASKFLDFGDWIKSFQGKGTLVLSEQHYTPAVQNAQAWIIQRLVQTSHARDHFDVGWEFLNFEDQKKIDRAIAKLKKEGNAQAAEAALFPGTRNGASASYYPVLRAVADLGGRLIGLNAPRDPIRRQVRTKGVASLPFHYVPPKFDLGGPHYWERFEKALGGHGGNLKSMKSFFVAQSYVDDVMAWKYSELRQHDLGFFIVGHFHADFGQGVMKRLPVYGTKDALQVRILAGAKMSAKQLELFIRGSKRYGPHADYLVISY